MSVSEAAEKACISETTVVQLYKKYLEKRNIGVLNPSTDDTSISPENAQRALGMIGSIYGLIEATIEAERSQLAGNADGMLGAASLDPRSAAAAKSWINVASTIMKDHPGLLAIAGADDIEDSADADIDDRLKAAFETA